MKIPELELLFTRLSEGLNTGALRVKSFTVFYKSRIRIISTWFTPDSIFSPCSNVSRTISIMSEGLLSYSKEYSISNLVDPAIKVSFSSRRMMTSKKNKGYCRILSF